MCIFKDKSYLIFSKDKTFIVVTHRKPILALTKRIIVVENGKLVMDGERDEVLSKFNEMTGLYDVSLVAI